MNTFEFVGKIVPVKDRENRKAFEEKTYPSGWMTKKLSFEVVSGDDKHFVSINAGRWSDEKKAVIKFFKGKEDVTEIAWSQRNDPDTIQSVIDDFGGYRVFTVDCGLPSIREEARASGDEAAIAKAEGLKKHFLSNMDFCEYVNKLVNTESVKDMVFKISGNIDVSYSDNYASQGKNPYFITYEVKKIYRVDPNTEESSKLNLDLFFGSDCVNKELFEDTGKIDLNTYIQFYDSKSKKNFFAPYPTVLMKDNSEKADLKLKKFISLFQEAKDEVKKMSISAIKVSGAQKVSNQFGYDDLSDEQKENVDFGLTTLEDAIRDICKDNNVVMYDSKIVNEVRVIGLGRGGTKGVESTAFLDDDLVDNPSGTSVVAQKKQKSVDDDIDAMFSDIVDSKSPTKSASDDIDIFGDDLPF